MILRKQNNHVFSLKIEIVHNHWENNVVEVLLEESTG